MLLYFETFQSHTYPIFPICWMFWQSTAFFCLRIWWCRAWWRRVLTSSTSTSPARRWRTTPCGLSPGTHAVCRLRLAARLPLYGRTLQSGALSPSALWPRAVPFPELAELFLFKEKQSSARLAGCYKYVIMRVHSESQNKNQLFCYDLMWWLSERWVLVLYCMEMTEGSLKRFPLNSDGSVKKTKMSNNFRI